MTTPPLALVTGAARRLGKTFALKLAHMGYSIALHYRGSVTEAEKTAEEIQDGLKRATKRIDTCLNMIGGRLGLDHDRVLFGKFGIPVMVNYIDRRNGTIDERTRDKMLFWFVQAGMWGRFSGSTESFIDQDLSALEGDDGGLDKLLEQLRLWHGGLKVEPGHFIGWGIGAYRRRRRRSLRVSWASSRCIPRMPPSRFPRCR